MKMIQTFFEKRTFVLIALFFLFGVIYLNAQIKVKGVVVDENKDPLYPVTIIVKGTANGVQTDLDGNFTITVPNSKAVLNFSYIGYIKQDITVGNQTNMKVQLEPDSKMLDDVVIVGFGVQKRANATGAVRTIDNKAIESRPITSAVDGLQGVVAGLNITNDQGGAPGTNMNFNIRGVGSVGSGSNSSPLVIIDGIEGNLESVNPNDILNVSVLKDAAAASIYGSRAPFGVILVTTKGGEKGSSVTYTGNLRINQPINVPRMVDSYTYALMINEALLNAGGSAQYSQGQIINILAFQNGLKPYETSANTNNNTWYGGLNAWGNNDWYDVHLRNTTYSQEHNVSISGGGEKTNYYFSGNFLDQNGLFTYADDYFRRFTISGKINVKMNDKMTLNWTTRFMNNENNKPSAMNDLFYHNLGRRYPNMALRLPNGEYSSESLIPALSEGGRYIVKGQQIVNQAQFTYEPIKKWKVYADVGSRIENPRETKQYKKITSAMPDRTEIFIPIFEGVADITKVNDNGTITRQAPAGTSYYEIGKGFNNYFSTNARTDYELALNDHNFKFLVGVQSEYYYMEMSRLSSDDILIDETPFIPQVPVNGLAVDKKGEWANFGAFSRINYDYAGRYLLELNFRTDAASRFPAHKRWGYFPAASIGWNIAEEKFWAPVKKFGVELLKFRASYGALGNQNTSSFYPYFQKITPGRVGAVIGNQETSGIPAPAPYATDITWETVVNSGVGLDFSMFKNRLTGSVDLFDRTTKDMIGPSRALPNIYGATLPKTNNAELQTRGWEFEIAYQDRLNKNFSYNVGFTISDYQSTVTKFESSDGSINTFYKGMRLNEIWGYRVQGIAKSDQEMEAWLNKYSQSSIGDGATDRWGAGDLMYLDKNDDNKINQGARTLADHGDLEIIGNGTPRFSYGIRLGCQWKFIDASVFLQGVGKRDIFFDGSATFFGVVAPYQRSLFTEHTDYFRPAGHPLGANLDPYYARLRTDRNNTMVSDYYLQDASYLRVKNFQIGFSLPKNTPIKKVVKNARLYISGENLLTFTKLRIVDPEAVGGGGYGPGKTYPMFRTFSVGLNVTL